ncbi:hypothetical protein BDD12DRAFT_898305 [Trichophaea hybrida]|nr:hypothetical protein BDD12DRAFT_898305 [Trichophaea hybrida]
MQMTVPDRNDPARRVFVTLEYLEEQAKGQELYYMNYKKPREHDHDIIFELLQTEKRLSVAIPLRRAHRTGRLGFHIQEQLLAEARVNPLDLESLSHTAEGGVVAATLSSLMEKTNTAQEDWAQDGELYQRCQRSVALKKIRRIKAQVIQVITDRSIEVDIVHRRTRGHKQAKKLQIADILKPIPLPVPAVSEEEEVEGEDEEITEAIEDELFEVHGHDLEEEVAARIMMQDEITTGDIDGIGSDDDFSNESELLQDLTRF